MKPTFYRQFMNRPKSCLKGAENKKCFGRWCREKLAVIWVQRLQITYPWHCQVENKKTMELRQHTYTRNWFFSLYCYYLLRRSSSYKTRLCFVNFIVFRMGLLETAAYFGARLYSNVNLGLVGFLNQYPSVSLQAWQLSRNNIEVWRV